jgi:hypothetical protein
MLRHKSRKPPVGAHGFCTITGRLGRVTNPLIFARRIFLVLIPPPSPYRFPTTTPVSPALKISSMRGDTLLSGWLPASVTRRLGVNAKQAAGEKPNGPVPRPH